MNQKKIDKMCKKAGQDIYRALEQLPELMDKARKLGLVDEGIDDE